MNDSRPNNFLSNMVDAPLSLQAGGGRTAPPLALRGRGAQDATPPAIAPTGQNVILQMDPVPAQPVGGGRAATNRARYVL